MNYIHLYTNTVINAIFNIIFIVEGLTKDIRLPWMSHPWLLSFPFLPPNYILNLLFSQFPLYQTKTNHHNLLYGLQYGTSPVPCFYSCPLKSIFYTTAQGTLTIPLLKKFQRLPIIPFHLVLAKGPWLPSSTHLPLCYSHHDQHHNDLAMLVFSLFIDYICLKAYSL